jgi:hypothetical protein
VHVIPGNIIYARVSEIVRLFERRGLHDRLLDVVRQTVEHASNTRETVYAPVVVVVMHRSECRESRTRRHSARTAGGSAWAPRADWIGKCLARGKDKRDCTERRDERRSIGHGTHPFIGY